MSYSVRRFSRNERGNDYIVGDIHGTFTKLADLLTSIGFNPEGDRLFSVGDLVDRGPESMLALEWLSKPWFHAVSGNHEHMAMMWVRGDYDDKQNYIANGGAWFLALTRPEQCGFADAFSAMPLAIELETEAGTVGIIHAECPFPQFANLQVFLAGKHAAQVADHCVWSRERISNGLDSAVPDVRAVVVGHTPMAESVTLGNHIYIDTMGWRGGKFTILRADTLESVC